MRAEYRKTVPFDPVTDRGPIRLFDWKEVELVRLDRGMRKNRKRKRIQPKLYPLFDPDDDALFERN